MAKRNTRAPQVHKFGGASLAQARAVCHALAIFVSRKEAPLVVVISVPAGVTDALLALASAAVAENRDGLHAAVDTIRRRHRDVASNVIALARPRKVLNTIDAAFAERTVLLDGVASLREMTARTNDLIVARGVPLSATIVLNDLPKLATT
ncbi:MAG: hypothetical protein ABJB66_17640 [Gemmatimonadaceae bacterium]